MDRGVISGGMAAKGRAALKALAAGVPSIHVLDGRTPHGVIAELFTDNGVGTWIQENGRERRVEGQS
jgi:acetylglutamate kinase